MRLSRTGLNAMHFESLLGTFKALDGNGNRRFFVKRIAQPDPDVGFPYEILTPSKYFTGMVTYCFSHEAFRALLAGEPSVLPQPTLSEEDRHIIQEWAKQFC